MPASFSRRGFIRSTGAAALTLAALPAVAVSADNKRVLALLGVAHIHTPGFVDELKKRPDCVIKYVWDADPKLAEKTAAETGATAVTDIGVICADKSVDAVVILSQTNRHRELVLAAAKAGKHLFVEKPLGITGAESREMAEVIEQSGVLFTTGYFSRTDPKILFLKEEISKGRFGIITRVRASNCHGGALAGWFDRPEWRWMTDPQQSGVGAFGDLGTHKLDILIWLFGGIESVTGVIKSAVHRYGDCDEYGEAMLRFRQGMIGTLAAGWVDVEDPVKLEICGTQGHAVIYNEKLYYRSDQVETSDSRRPVKSLPPAPPQPLPQWLEALAGDRSQPLVSAREAAERVVVMEAIYEAARSQKWVTLK